MESKGYKEILGGDFVWRKKVKSQDSDDQKEQSGRDGKKQIGCHGEGGDEASHQERIFRELMEKEQGSVWRVEEKMGLKRSALVGWGKRHNIDVLKIRDEVLPKKIMEALARTRGKVKEASKELDFNSAYLSFLLKKYDIKPAEFRHCIEKERLLEVLENTNGSIKSAAHALKVEKWEIKFLIKRYKIDINEIRKKRILEHLPQSNGNIKKWAKLTGLSTKALGDFIEKDELLEKELDNVRLNAYLDVLEKSDCFTRKSKLAEKIGISPKTFARWRERYDWDMNYINQALLERALVRENGAVSRAAARISINEKVAYRWIQRYGIDLKQIQKTAAQLKLIPAGTVRDRTHEVRAPLKSQPFNANESIYSRDRYFRMDLKKIKAQLADVHRRIDALHPDKLGRQLEPKENIKFGKLLARRNGLLNKRHQYKERERRYREKNGLPLLLELQNNTHK